MMGYVFMRFGTEFQPENVDRLREKVGECLERCDIHGSTAFLLLNLMDELTCNILEHGKASWVELEVHPYAKEVQLIFRDDGPKFDPGPAMATEGSKETPGDDEGRSMGLYMVNQIAKTWKYDYVKGKFNELNLTVGLDQQSKVA
jgi:anti-sigma regulatory factor (Ser/Thr protein kinase)